MVRLSTENSKQHHKTPDELMAAIGRRFGPVVFDLAADKTNFRHQRYFAPASFGETFEASKISRADFAAALAERGAYEEEVNLAISRAAAAAEKLVVGRRTKVNVGKLAISVPNHDEAAAAYDGLAQGWAALTKEHGGFLFLNPEFKDIDPWAKKCVAEGRRGADVLLLVPAAVGSNWFLDRVYGVGDRVYLNGRISFIPGEPYMKDCMLVRFWKGMAGRAFVWKWRDDVVYAAQHPSLRVGLVGSGMLNTDVEAVA